MPSDDTLEGQYKAESNRPGEESEREERIRQLANFTIDLFLASRSEKVDMPTRKVA
jgi:hypothetical protein